MTEIENRSEEEQVWHDWLDGDSISRIARYSSTSPTRIKTILAGQIPDRMKDDPRHVYSCRAFWVSTSGIPAMVFMPRRCNGDIFKKALRAIRRLHERTGERMEPHVIEGLEVDAAIRMVQNRGARAYRFDQDGNVLEGLPAARDDAEEVAAPPTP